MFAHFFCSPLDSSNLSTSCLKCGTQNCSWGLTSAEWSRTVPSGVLPTTLPLIQPRVRLVLLGLCYTGGAEEMVTLIKAQ